MPDDVSVVGFDDIQNSAYITPSLTTVRQPLQEMGEVAARTLLDRIEGRSKYVPEITIEPEFIIRNSSAPPSSQHSIVGAKASAAHQHTGFLGPVT